MESESSDESQDDIDVTIEPEPEPEPEPEIEDDNNEDDDDQANSQSLDDNELDSNLQSRGIGPASGHQLGRSAPTVRVEALNAAVYDIVPTIAAPHSTSINVVASTPDLRWVFSGGSDGYIRKFNWIETANGKSMLTVAQRHPFVDSVTKAGVLTSYWENTDIAGGKANDDTTPLSAVYSLAVQSDALWLLSGLESGGINLQSVRHDEGKRIACLRGHTSAVSVLSLAADQRSFLSGSWDKTVLDWDLTTGKTLRTFEGSAGQISTLEVRPTSSLGIPEFPNVVEDLAPGLTSNNADEPRASHDPLESGEADPSGGPQHDSPTMNGTVGSPADSLFGGNDADSLFGDNEAVGPPNGTFDDNDNEFSRAIAQGLHDEDNQHSSDGPDVDVNGDTKINDAPLVVNGQMAGDAGAQNGDSKIEDSQIRADSGQNSSPVMNPTGLPLSEEMSTLSHESLQAEPPEPPTKSDTIFLAASFEGTLSIWDKRQQFPLARLTPYNVPPWCMNACWSPDGNFIYAGRRNCTVDEYSLHKGAQKPTRNFKLPNNSGAVSAVRTMPNGRHLICASYDILRLYDLQQQQVFKHATVPFLIVPGHRTSVVSQLYIDPSCRYLLSSAGNRGWEGSSSEVLLGYEICVPSS